MFWWRHQSNLRKILFIGAFMSLAAGISAGDKGIVGGVLLFVIFLVAGTIIPNKRSKTPEEKQWKKKITPRVYGNERNMRMFLSIVSLGIAIISTFFLFRSLLNLKYNLALITGFAAVFCFSSWVYLHPKYYNEIFTLQKIVPLRKPETIAELYDKVKDIKTPFGQPLMGLVEGLKEPVAVYRIIDFNWIVFFYIRDNEIIIRARNLNTEDVNLKESDWVILFTQQLADLFSYIQNTEELPNTQVLSKIFKLPYIEQ